jgi:hypothetical protein
MAIHVKGQRRDVGVRVRKKIIVFFLRELLSR